MDRSKVSATIQVTGPITVTQETDVPTLQKLAKDNYDGEQRAIKKLIKARAKIKELKARIAMLEGQVTRR